MSDQGENAAPPHGRVTDVPCRCGALHRAAAEPANPLVFHEATGTFHLTTYYPSHLDPSGAQHRGYAVVRHCYWCGGVAPKVHTQDRAQVPTTEWQRLRDLAADIRSAEDAIAKLGSPQRESQVTIKTHATASSPEVVRVTRGLRYEHLSATAILELTDYGPGEAIGVTIRPSARGVGHMP
jgi:hypothetical protein